jgi:hypothetical protein
MEARPAFETFWFLMFRIPDDGHCQVTQWFFWDPGLVALCLERSKQHSDTCLNISYSNAESEIMNARCDFPRQRADIMFSLPIIMALLRSAECSPLSVKADLCAQYNTLQKEPTRLSCAQIKYKSETCGREVSFWSINFECWVPLLAQVSYLNWPVPVHDTNHI